MLKPNPEIFQMYAIRALCDRLMKSEGDLTPEEISASLKFLGVNVRRKPVRRAKAKAVRRGIGSY